MPRISTSTATVKNTVCFDVATASDEMMVTFVLRRDTNWQAAFGALMKRHEPWIFRRCLLYLGHHHDAQDVTQDVVVRVLRSLNGFEGRASFRYWLMTIVDNCCKTYAVRRSRLVACQDIEAHIEPNECDSSVLGDDEYEIVNHVLVSLPANAREVLGLRFYGDYSLEEIARILGISLSAAKARLYRAIEHFKCCYLDLTDGDSSRFALPG